VTASSESASPAGGPAPANSTQAAALHIALRIVPRVALEIAFRAVQRILPRAALDNALPTPRTLRRAARTTAVVVRRPVVVGNVSIIVSPGKWQTRREGLAGGG